MSGEKNILDAALDLLEGGLDAFDELPSTEEKAKPGPRIIDVAPSCQLCSGERYCQEDDGSFQPCPLCNNKFKESKPKQLKP